VDYHYGRFPPDSLDYGRLMRPISAAAAALARYDQMLKSLHNSEIMLAPMRSREAVISSRIEGTISTLDEILRIEAEEFEDDEGGEIRRPERYRNEAIEVFLYQKAMRRAQSQMETGYPINDLFLRSTHKTLLGFGRGADVMPGEFKVRDNFVADRLRKKIEFRPIAPIHLPEGLQKLYAFLRSDREPLVKTALMHVEFEALHPFNDGNGRVGRILIPLILWQEGVLSAPHFYISRYLEDNRETYIEAMRSVSREDAWTDWCVFFLNALEHQAEENLRKAQEIGALYEEMKVRFREELSSKWHLNALDFIFGNPVFKASSFLQRSGVPRATAQRFLRVLAQSDLLSVVVPPSGRRPTLYAFEALLALVRV